MACVFLLSCSDDLTNTDDRVSITTSYENLKIENNRFVFDSEDHFRVIYHQLSNDISKNKKVLADTWAEKIYNSGFKSLYPIFDDNDSKHVYETHINDAIHSINMNESISKSNSTNDPWEDFDDLEDILGESAFSALLNNNAEVTVGGKVFKYTDAGLFIAPSAEYGKMIQAIQSNGLSTNIMIPSPPQNVVNFIDNENPCGGLIDLSLSPNPLQHFSAPDHVIGSNPCSGIVSTPSGGTAGPGSGTSNSSPDDHLNASLTLDICSGDRPLIGNIFGTTIVCHDEYTSNRRVKNKYYDIDLFLAYAMGIKVKHQYKGFLGWRKEDITEMGMGLNSITWKFTPQIYNTVGGIPQSSTIIYVDGIGYSSVQDYVNGIHIGDIPVPSLPFNQGSLDVIIEITSVIPIVGLDNERDVTEFVYSTIFNQLRSQFSSLQGRELKKAGVVLKTGSEVWVQYYDLDRKCNDCSVLEEILDWGVSSPQVTYTFGNGGEESAGSWSFNYDFNFRNPEALQISGYGMARHGSNPWHGNRIKFQ